jgi:hypothetical protein
MWKTRFALVWPLVMLSCNQDALTRDEAVAALSEASVESEASALTTAPIEIATHVTIGATVESAAQDLRAFLAAELPCAKITAEGATITTEWGTTSGCAYRGSTYTGTSVVTIKRTDTTSVEVDHTYADLSNGKVKVSGSAHVTWSSSEASRHVVHDLVWTRLADQRTGRGTGDRTQSLIDPAAGVAGGIRIDGNRHWSGVSGEWDLAITGVELRLQDPVPQAGAYELTTPNGKSVSLGFTRQTADTIRVKLSGPKRAFSFDVRSTGAIVDS